MIVLLDTSTPTCRLTLVENDSHYKYTWEAGRELARDLLGFLSDALAEHNSTLQDILAIGVMKGPGSFTGLRIGLTVMNTLADDRHIPIVGATGGAWQRNALTRLAHQENDELVLPLYGTVPTITSPRK